MVTNWELMKRIREQGFRQGFVASRLGIPEERLSRIIHGRTQPTPDEQRAITGFLGRDVFVADAGHSSEGDRHAASK